MYSVLYIYVSRINLKIREYYHDITSNYVKAGINFPPAGSAYNVRIRALSGIKESRSGEAGEKDRERG